MKLVLREICEIMKSKIKVCIVCRFPLSKKFYSFQLAEALRRVGVKSFLYGPKCGVPQTLSEDERILRVWTPLTYVIDIPRRAIKDKVHIIHIQFELPTFLLIGSFLLPLLLLILKITGRKVIITLHGPIFPRYETSKYVKCILPHFRFPIIAGLLLHILYLLLDRLSDRIIVHANIFKKWLIEFGLRKIHVIYHGVENKVEDIEMLSTNRYSEKDIILCLGTIAPRKGIDSFLQAISLIKDELKKTGIKAVIAGPPSLVLSDRDYLQKLLRYYKALKDESIAVVKGFLPDNELEKLLEKVKVLCLPYPISISASGILAIAISRNIPVIVSDTPYFKEILGEDYPLFVRPNDPHELANTLRSFITYETIYLEKIHERFLFLRKKLAWDYIAFQHYKLYLNVVD